MEWRDDGLIIGMRRHGESAAIVEAMTRGHGRHLGLARHVGPSRAGGGQRAGAAVQPGDSVALVWRARLETNLGAYTIEPTRSRAAVAIGPASGLHGLNWMCALLRLLPERDPHPALYDAALVLADHLDAPEVARALTARFELAMLAELGFGLDLSCCAATGATQELIYVSPKSGRAVSRAAGAPWADRLLPLPALLRGDAAGESTGDTAAALRTTGYFLERDLFAPRGLALPECRRAFAAGLA